MPVSTTRRNYSTLDFVKLNSNKVHIYKPPRRRTSNMFQNDNYNIYTCGMVLISREISGAHIVFGGLDGFVVG